MDVFDNEITIQQGEEFSIDILVSASEKEYIPFIISSERNNPYFVITVSSTKSADFKAFTWWNDPFSINEIPRFYQTTPVYIGEFEKNTIPTQPYMLPNGYSNEENATRRYLYQYQLTDEEIDDTIGHKPYHYLYFEYNEDDTIKSIQFDTYSCRIRQTFPSTITSQWNSGTYHYQISLVSGETLSDVLLQKAIYEIEFENCLDFPIARDEKGEILYPQPEEYIEAQYDYVKTVFPTYLQKDIDINSPLGYIEVVEPILKPTKINVSNNVRQII